MDLSSLNQHKSFVAVVDVVFALIVVVKLGFLGRLKISDSVHCLIGLGMASSKVQTWLSIAGC